MNLYFLLTEKTRYDKIKKIHETVVINMLNSVLPFPKSFNAADGVFSLENCDVYVADGLDVRVIGAAEKLKSIISEKTGGRHHFCRASSPVDGSIFIALNSSLSTEAYTVDISQNSILVSGGDDAGCFYAIATLKQLIKNSDNSILCCRIEDCPDMKHRGFYYDCTRGRVISVEGAKKLIDRMAQYKINSFQLYVEHSFDFKEFETDIRTEKDYLTAEDLLEIDRYCHDNFIDFVPSLSTFGHLYELLCKKEYAHLCELEGFTPSKHFWHERQMHHTIDASNPESLKLVTSLIDQYLPLFSSDYFNICCDETFDLCMGRNSGKDKAELYIDFVSKIISHVHSAGKTVMMWGDIALQHPELLYRIPKGTVLLNWDYCANPNTAKIEKVAATGIDQIVCPGTSSWASLIENTDISVSNITKTALCGYKNGALGVLNTCWGDYGHPCHPECSLYGMLVGACMSWNCSTVIDTDFEKSACALLYSCPTNIIPLINGLGKAHSTASWHSLFAWRWHRDTSMFPADIESVSSSIQNCEEIIAALSKVNAEKELIDAILNAARGILILNKAVLRIKQNGSVSDSFRREAKAWFEDYEKCWLRSSKPSEIREISDFLQNF